MSDPPRREGGTIPPIARSTLSVSAGIAGWIVSGLVLNALLARQFGAGLEMDAYLAASALPTLLSVVVQGALTLTLLPLLVEMETRGETEAGRRLLAGLFRWSLLVLGALSILCVLFAGPILRTLAPGLPDEGRDLAAGNLRALAASIPLQGIVCLFQSVHYARHRYVLASFVPIAGNLATIAIVLALASRWGVVAAAWGASAGSLVQCLLLLPVPGPGSALATPGGWGEPGVRRLARLLWPILLGSVLYRGNAVVERFIASYGPEKSISHLGYATKIVGLLVLLLTQGLGLALLGRFSAQATLRDPGALRDSLSKALRAVLVATTPAVLLLAAVRVPLIQVLFERREFLPEDSRGTADALLCYSGAIYGACLGTIFSRVLYAYQRTGLAAAIGIAGAAAHLGVAALLFRAFGYLGVAVAFSVSQLATVAPLALAARRLLGNLDGKRALVTAGKALLASIPMALVALLLVGALGLEGAAMGPRLAGLALVGATSVLLFVGAAGLLRIPEVRTLKGEVGRLLRFRST
jgi:putative peptidoglycan lipid II flippase